MCNSVDKGRFPFLKSSNLPNATQETTVTHNFVDRYSTRRLIDLLGALWLVQPNHHSCIVIGRSMRLHIDGSVCMRSATAHFGHFPYDSFHGLNQTM
jgi:hypothetical protein